VAVSLTHADVAAAAADVPAIEAGADVLEFRVDLLADRGPDAVRRQFAALRRAAAGPLLWTVRTRGQGGAFDGPVAELFALLALGVRLGSEFVDVEGCWPVAARMVLARGKGLSRLVASFHDFDEARFYPADALLAVLESLRHDGLADVVKAAVRTARPEQVSAVAEAVARFRAAHAGDPGGGAAAVGLCMGAEGRLSRVASPYLTFCTHPLLPGAAAPGQLPAAEVRRLRAELGLSPPRRRFLLFGSPIAKSASPAMHNAAFAALGLAGWEYGRCETADPAAALAAIREAGFGGGSVTMPLKEALLPHMDLLTDAARRIGAVNTITAREPATGGGPAVLVGDNTDWLAIRRLVEDRVAVRRLRAGGGQRALLIGAGGTARAAMYALGRVAGLEGPVLVYNRTAARAAALAAEFGGEAVADLGAVGPVGVVVSTLPPEAHDAVPDRVFQGRPVVLDASYLPGGAPLARRARAAGCELVVGPHMLFEQVAACKPPHTRAHTHRRRPHPTAPTRRSAPRVVGVGAGSGRSLGG
jgi:pentafunctional AROM polypeptide